MIWLSPTSGTNNCSIYFEIRDIDLQCHGDINSGVVRGLLGDGYCELWGEVFLGSVEYAQILPVWTESGEVESFSTAVDESLLQQQMLSEVKIFLQKLDNTGDHSPADDRPSSDFSEPAPACNLAA